MKSSDAHLTCMLTQILLARYRTAWCHSTKVEPFPDNPDSSPQRKLMTLPVFLVS